MSNGQVTGRRLGELTEVNDASISRWKTGKLMPTISNLVAVARAFGVSPVRLLLTIGAITQEEAGGVDPLPLEPLDPTYAAILKIPGLTDKGREKMWATVLGERESNGT